MTYPQKTIYTCPVCDFDVVLDEWTHTVADHEGEPQEQSGTGHYCTRKECEHYRQPIDHDDLLTPSQRSNG